MDSTLGDVPALPTISVVEPISFTRLALVTCLVLLVTLVVGSRSQSGTDHELYSGLLPFCYSKKRVCGPGISYFCCKWIRHAGFDRLDEVGSWVHVMSVTLSMLRCVLWHGCGISQAVVKLII